MSLKTGLSACSRSTFERLEGRGTLIVGLLQSEEKRSRNLTEYSGKVPLRPTAWSFATIDGLREECRQVHPIKRARTVLLNARQGRSLCPQAIQLAISLRHRRFKILEKRLSYKIKSLRPIVICRMTKKVSSIIHSKMRRTFYLKASARILSKSARIGTV